MVKFFILIFVSIVASQNLKAQVYSPSRISFHNFSGFNKDDGIKLDDKYICNVTPGLHSYNKTIYAKAIAEGKNIMVLIGPCLLQVNETISIEDIKRKNEEIKDKLIECLSEQKGATDNSSRNLIKKMNESTKTGENLNKASSQ